VGVVGKKSREFDPVHKRRVSGGLVELDAEDQRITPCVAVAEDGASSIRLPRLPARLALECALAL
jgi:hypothetical protein